MSKTTKEWFDTIPDPEIRERALANIDENAKDEKEPSLVLALTNGLYWKNPEEGLQFWTDMIYTFHQNYASFDFMDINVPDLSSDPINPSHYKNAIETINAIEASMTLEAFRGYLKGNVIKYVTRYEKKNGVEDLKKADWYLSKLINTFASE
jgi:hypothetical protein